MPLTSKGNEIMGAMEREYGAEKGKSVFYASRNAGKITGVDRADALYEEKETLTPPEGNVFERYRVLGKNLEAMKRDLRSQGYRISYTSQISASQNLWIVNASKKKSSRADASGSWYDTGFKAHTHDRDKREMEVRASRWGREGTSQKDLDEYRRGWEAAERASRKDAAELTPEQKKTAEQRQAAVQQAINRDKRIGKGEGRKIQALLKGWRGTYDDTAFERDLTDDQPRVVIGVKGVKSKPFRRRFANAKAMDRWFDSDEAGDVDVQYVQRADAASLDAALSMADALHARADAISRVDADYRGETFWHVINNGRSVAVYNSRSEATAAAAKMKREYAKDYKGHIYGPPEIMVESETLRSDARSDASNEKIQAAYERGQKAGKADRSAPLGARGRSMSSWVAYSELKGEEKEAWVRGYRSA